jgi:hypothetical protein
MFGREGAPLELLKEVLVGGGTFPTCEQLLKLIVVFVVTFLKIILFMIYVMQQALDYEKKSCMNYCGGLPFKNILVSFS